MITALLLLHVSAAPGIEPELAGRYFAEAREISNADATSLWGRELYGPMIFVDPATQTVAANAAPRSGSLEPRGATGSVFIGPLPEGLGIANTAQRWDGELWTTVVWPLPKDRYDRRKLLAHELYHRLQPALGECAFDALPASHLDTREGRTWLRLEARALGEALLRDGVERRTAVADALLFRALRHSKFPDAHAAEVALESNEGVAEYTGLRLSGLPTHVLPDRAAVRLARFDVESTFGRSFAYATGPGYALLLDEVTRAGMRPSWRDAFGGTADFGALVGAAYSIDLPPDLSSAARARLGPYDGAAVLAEEDALDRQRTERLASYTQRFVQGPVLVLPATGEVHYTFNPYGVETLPGLGQVYATLEVRDAWGLLEVESGGALLLRDDAGRVSGFRVPAPIEEPPEHDAVVVGDGYRLTLAMGWRLEAGRRPGDVVVVE